MTAQLIFCITIILFLASPVCSVPQKLEGKSGAVCTNRMKETIYCNSTIYKEFMKKNDAGLYLDHVKDHKTDGKPKNCEEAFLEDRQSNGHHQTTQDSYIEVLTNQSMCCEGYKNESGTCQPQCSPECENGVCSKPNVCNCHYHWGGHFCNETLFCTITQPLPVNGTEKGETGTTEEADIQSSEKLPECRPECLNEVNNTCANARQSGNMTYYFCPINSLCNTVVTPWIKYRYAIAGGLGILIITMIVCIVLIVAKKRRRDPVHDIPLETKHPEYMVDNSIYS